MLLCFHLLILINPFKTGKFLRVKNGSVPIISPQKGVVNQFCGKRLKEKIFKLKSVFDFFAYIVYKNKNGGRNFSSFFVMAQPFSKCKRIL